jgi:hypothetical protein
MSDCAKLKGGEGPCRLTWQELTDLEPELMSLLWEARQSGAACRARSDVSVAFAPFRSRLAELIGFQSRHRGHPVLGSAGAYQAAYGKLYDAVSGLLSRGRALAAAN